jgi:hypothetical protein
MHKISCWRKVESLRKMHSFIIYYNMQLLLFVVITFSILTKANKRFHANLTKRMNQYSTMHQEWWIPRHCMIQNLISLASCHISKCDGSHSSIFDYPTFFLILNILFISSLAARQQVWGSGVGRKWSDEFVNDESFTIFQKQLKKSCKNLGFHCKIYFHSRIFKFTKN